MTALGALSQAWSAAEAALPLGWRVSGVYRFGELWIGLAEGPAFEDYASGSGREGGLLACRTGATFDQYRREAMTRGSPQVALAARPASS
jgi:hypothetical protein